MTTYLALKHAAPSGLLSKLFHGLTKARLLTMYPHAGIVKGGMLMHSNLAHGLHSEPFEPNGWHLFPLSDAAQIDTRFELYEGVRYDWFSLLAFVLPWRVRDKSRMYCYEWCWLAMTGEHPVERITPEMLLVELRKGTS